MIFFLWENKEICLLCWVKFFLLQPKEITWSPSRVFPPVRACMFSSHLTSVTFLADPSAGGGLPRGTFIYATSPLPVQVRGSWQLFLYFKLVRRGRWYALSIVAFWVSPSSGVSSGPVFLLGDWDCFLWRYWWWHWTNRLIWLCYRSWEAWWGMDQSSRHLPFPQVSDCSCYS